MKWFLIGILSVLILFVSYDVYFKYKINYLQEKQIEQSIQANYWDNQINFQELINYSKTIEEISDLEFFENEFIHFQIYDSVSYDLNRMSNLIELGKDAYNVYAKDIVFSDTNSIIVIAEEGKQVLENWAISFKGKMTDSIVIKILSYNRIGLEELKQIRQRMEKVNCNAFNKNENLLTLRYKGHWGESFNYQIPLRDSVHMESWNKLSDNYYWEHHQEELFCGWTDW